MPAQTIDIIHVDSERLGQGVECGAVIHGWSLCPPPLQVKG
jgi:hypothetical protein